MQVVLDVVEAIIYLYFPKFIIDGLTRNITWSEMLTLILTFAASVLTVRVFKKMNNKVLSMSVQKTDMSFQKMINIFFLNMDYEQLENGDIRLLESKISSHMHPNMIMDAMSGLISSLLKILTLSVLISTLTPLILLLIAITIVLNYFIDKKRKVLDFDFRDVQQTVHHRIKYLSRVMLDFEYAKEIRINDASELLLGNLEMNSRYYARENNNRMKKNLKYGIINNIIDFFSIIAIYGYVGYMVVANRITIGSFSFCISAIYQFTSAFTGLVSSINGFVLYDKYIEEYKQFLNLVHANIIQQGDSTVPNGKYVLEFKNVYFTYPNTNIQILKNISIRIEQGDKLSIVGANGSGKTTFVKLLCRLYTPDSGTIKLNDIDIYKIKNDEYFKLISVVFQDFKLFSFSVRDNIILNLPYEEQMLNAVVSKSGLEEKVLTLPEGIETSINKEFDEKGIEFSGGEAQRIAIAKACYKNSPIVILDEPTAALDVVMEETFYRNFNEIMSNNTGIFISHRLASTRFCDKIAVFEKGEIVEYGHYEQLMKLRGLYYKMFETQAEYYRDEI
jgi:ATP-binding cassette subfamily B protein/ATP-binding cassette subfamily C protein